MSQPEETIAGHVERQLSDARLRVLIIGAGIAGATLAALLKQRGEPVAMIERHNEAAANGYMLGLLPLGGRVLNALGLREDYISASQPMRNYVLHDRNGRVAMDYDLSSITKRYGLYRGIERGALLDLLRGMCGPIRYGASIRAINEIENAVHVTFSDGSKVQLDCVVMADGIHSHSRGLLLTDSDVKPYDTGWGGFVAWADLVSDAPQTYREFWSAGWGIGLYPVPGRTALFLAGRDAEIAGSCGLAYAKELLERGLPEPFDKAIRAIDPNSEAVYWPMADVRSNIWSRGRSVLLGDAAAAFLPTAGVGASMAMDSAAALSDELSRAEPDKISYALSLYERRQRPRVERAQKNSRQLGRFMFMNSRSLTAMRDQAIRFYTMDRLIADIARVMDGT